MRVHRYINKWNSDKYFLIIGTEKSYIQTKKRDEAIINS